MIPLRRPSGCRFADRLIMNERTPVGPPLVSYSGHCCKFSVGIRMIPKRAASAKPVTPPAGKLPQAVRTPSSLGELRGAFIEKQAACLSPVRCMPPLPSGERSDGVAGRTGLCTGAECDACEVISVALTASVKKGRPLSADTAFTNVFSFSAGCSAVIVHRETAPHADSVPIPAEKLLPNGAHRVGSGTRSEG